MIKVSTITELSVYMPLWYSKGLLIHRYNSVNMTDRDVVQAAQAAQTALIYQTDHDYQHHQHSVTDVEGVIRTTRQTPIGEFEQQGILIALVR